MGLSANTQPSASTSFEKWNKELLAEAHQHSCVPGDFWRLHQVFIIKQLHHMLLFCLSQTHKCKGGTKLNPVNYVLLFPDLQLFIFFCHKVNVLDINPASINVCLPYPLKWSLCAFIEIPSPQKSNFFILDPNLIMVEQEKCQKSQLRETGLTVLEGGKEVCASNRNRDVVKLISAPKHSELKNQSDILCECRYICSYKRLQRMVIEDLGVIFIYTHTMCASLCISLLGNLI